MCFSTSSITGTKYIHHDCDIYYDYKATVLLSKVYDRSTEYICVTAETYFQLLNRTYFALLVVLLSNWSFILWVVHQLSLHNPLSSVTTSQQWRDGGKRNDKDQGMGEDDERMKSEMNREAK